MCCVCAHAHVCVHACSSFHSIPQNEEYSRVLLHKCGTCWQSAPEKRGSEQGILELKGSQARCGEVGLLIVRPSTAATLQELDEMCEVTAVSAGGQAMGCGVRVGPTSPSGLTSCRLTCLTGPCKDPGHHPPDLQTDPTPAPCTVLTARQAPPEQKVSMPLLPSWHTEGTSQGSTGHRGNSWD